MTDNQGWWYNGKYIDSEDSELIPIDAIGFVYIIEKYEYPYPTVAEELERLMMWKPVKIYIGKKSMTSTRKSKIGVRAQAKQKAETGDGRVKKVQRITKSSGWLGYNSSCKPLIEDMKEHPELYRKEIIQWCWSKKNLSYSEEYWQYKYRVLEIDSWNDNIGGRYYKHDANKQKWEAHKEKMKNTPRVRKPKVKKEIPY